MNLDDMLRNAGFDPTPGPEQDEKTEEVIHPLLDIIRKQALREFIAQTSISIYALVRVFPEQGDEGSKFWQILKLLEKLLEEYDLENGA